MTIEDGHFRSDGKTIEPCCDSMEAVINLEDLDCTIIGKHLTKNSILAQFSVECSDKTKVWFVDIRFCPFCGAKLEWKKKEE